MQNQIDLVELTKSRLIGLHEFKKLEKDAMEEAIRGINPKDTMGPTNHLKAYLPHMCDKTFQYLLVKLEQIPEENQREHLDKIDFLLTEETKFLDLGNVFSKRKSIPVKNYDAINDAELKLVAWVTGRVKNQAPSIEQIVFNNMRFYFDNHRHMNFIDDLTNFQQLKKLVMVLIDLETPRVLNLCRKLPQLQILEINSFSSDGLTVQEIRQSLENLRLLVGHTEEWEKRGIQQQFPHLNIASFIQNGALSTFRPVKHEDFFVDEIGTPPQRKYFSCGKDWFNLRDTEIHLTYPDVTYLEINVERVKTIPTTTEQLPDFSKINTLIALNCKNETIITDILSKYGKGLRSLWIESSDQQSFGVKILGHCPELEAILLDGIRITDTSTQPVNLPHLKELYLIRSSEERFLPNILSSPHLKKIEITGDFFMEDLMELNTKVYASQILQELESIKISTRIRAPDAFRELLDFLEIASAYLPKLKDILFTYEDENYIDVARRLRNGQHHEVVEIRNIIVNNVSLVPILESFSRLRT